MSKLFDFRVRILAGALGWVDITPDVRGDIDITRGRSGEGYRADPGKCGFRLDNRTGRYSPRNPASDLYGYIGRNTPVEVYAGPTGGALVARFFGEIPAWPPRWSLSGADRYVDIDAVGMLARFRQGDQPALSPMRRTIAASGPLAYWPVEDGGSATQAGSAVNGVAAATVTNAVEFTTVEDLVLFTGTLKYGTDKLVNLAAGGSIAGAVPPGPATAWTVAVSMQVDPANYAADVVILEWTTPGGTYDRWQIVATKAWTGPEGDWTEQLIAYPASGAAPVYARISTGVSTGFNLWTASAEQVGGNIVTSLAARAPVSIAGTLAPVATIMVNATGTTSTAPMPAGHLVVWPLNQLPAGVVPSGESNRKEAATVRLRRVAVEAGYAVTGPATPAGSDPPMGPQLTASTTALLDESSAADGGLLFEDRAQMALAYRPRGTLYNQTPVAIAYVGQTSDLDVDDSADDVRNDITVERVDGSSARAVQLTGPMAAVEPPTGVGIYTEAPKLNVDTDAVLPDQAGWRLRLGTVDEPRYPAISVQLAEPSWLAAPASLRDQLLALDVGGVLEVTSPPAWVSGRVRTLVTGYTESIGEWTWRITFNGTPASPWDVAEADGDQLVPADGSTLAAALGTESPDPVNADPYLTAGDLAAWTPSNATVVRSTTTTHDGYASLQITANGGVSGGANATALAPIDAAATWRASLWAWSATATTVGPAVDCHDAAGGYITTSFIGPTAIPAGTWTLVTGTFTPPGGTTQARMRARHDAATPAGRVWHATQIILARVVTVQLASTTGNGVWTTSAADFPQDLRIGGERVTATGISGSTSPQTVTLSARGVNGVARAWPIGTEVDVYKPAIAPL